MESLLAISASLPGSAACEHLEGGAGDTAYLQADLAKKLAILDQHGVQACAGGTLVEAE